MKSNIIQAGYRAVEELIKVSAQINTYLADDPANYILNIGQNQEVIQAYERSTVEGISTMLELQAHMEVPVQDRRIMTKDQVKQTASFLNQMTDPRIFRSSVAALQKEYGEFFDNDGNPSPTASLYELLSAEGDLNPSYSFAISYLDHQLFSAIFEGAKINPKIIDKDLKNDGDALVNSMDDIRKKLSDDSSMLEFMDILKITGKNSHEMAEYISNFVDVMARTAAVIRLTDPRSQGGFNPAGFFSAGDIEGYIADEFIEKRFDMYDTYAVPKAFPQLESSAPGEFIKEELDFRLENAFEVYKDIVAPFSSINPNLSDDDLLNDTLNEIQANGVWVNTNNFGGVQLMISREGSFDSIPVLDRNGDPIIINFSSLIDQQPLGDHRSIGDQMMDEFSHMGELFENLRQSVDPSDREPQRDRPEQLDPRLPPDQRSSFKGQFKRDDPRAPSTVTMHESSKVLIDKVNKTMGQFRSSIRDKK